jgi:hypothetical protein
MEADMLKDDWIGKWVSYIPPSEEASGGSKQGMLKSVDKQTASVKIGSKVVKFDLKDVHLCYSQDVVGGRNN